MTSLDLLIYLVCFILFVNLQSFFIIGLNHCFKGEKSVDGLSGKEFYTGMIFYLIAPKFFEKHKHKEWSKPIWSCYRCMSSVWGLITFWSFALLLFGFHRFLIPISIFDVFSLVSINGYVYKKI